MMKTISVLALGALAVGCHLDKLLTGSGGGPRPTSHAPPAGLRFATQPPQSASVSQLIRVDVSVVDSAGVLVAGAETVMVVVALDAGSVSLGGTTTAHPVRGVASFPDLSVNQAGTYRLVASALGFQARSDQFEIDQTDAFLRKQVRLNGQVYVNEVVHEKAGVPQTVFGVHGRSLPSIPFSLATEPPSGELGGQHTVQH